MARRCPAADLRHHLCVPVLLPRDARDLALRRQARLAAPEWRLQHQDHGRLDVGLRLRRVQARDPAGDDDPRHLDRRLDSDDAQQHDLGARRGLRTDGARQGPEPWADHVDIRRKECDPAQPDGLRDVPRLRGQRRDPRRVRLQLSGRRLDVSPVGREPGLRAHAGPFPDDRHRRADLRPCRGCGDGAPRPPHA